jgi:hypothetical protein
MKLSLLDLSGQFFSVGVSLLDRLALTACLVRFWGIAVFENWSIILAGTTLLSSLDFGMQMHFGNRLVIEAGKGEQSTAKSIYRQSNSVFLGLGALAVVITTCILAVPGLRSTFGLPQALSRDDQLIFAALAFSVAFRLAMTNLSSVYRLNRAIGRGAVLFALVEALRVVTVGVLAIAGSGPAAGAMATALATLIGIGILLPADIARRFPDFRYRVAPPTMRGMENAFSNGGLYFVQLFPNLALTQLPVLLIGATATATGALGSFLLIRTLVNFARLLVQQVVSLAGMECARLAAEEQLGFLERVYTHTNRCVAAIVGCLSAGLLGFGVPLFRYWVGQPDLYRFDLLLLMILPLLLAPSGLLANAYLQYANRPFFPAFGRTLHAALAFVAFVSWPTDDISLRLTFAISVTELFGFAIPQIYASPAALNSKRLLDELGYVGISLSAFGATGAIAAVTKAALPPDTIWKFALDVLLVGGCAALAIWALFLTPRRLRLLNADGITTNV